METPTLAALPERYRIEDAKPFTNVEEHSVATGGLVSTLAISIDSNWGIRVDPKAMKDQRDVGLIHRRVNRLSLIS
jgi:hypothetical protein